MYHQTEVSDIRELIVSSKKVGKKVAKKVSYVDADLCIGKWFILPIKLECATNKREHWSTIAYRKKEQRSLSRSFTSQCFTMPYGPIVVTITRVGLRKMDDDNLATSAKYVRDGIADALGIDDGDSRIKWEYKQEIGRAYGAKVEIKADGS